MDTQIVMESFMEDINNLLNAGEVPNLFELARCTFRESISIKMAHFTARGWILIVAQRSANPWLCCSYY